MKVKKAIIPVAGLGTRFLPATKAQPKEMMPIVDKPAVQYIVEEAVEAGIDHILFVTGRNKKSIEDHFDRSVELEQHLEAKNKEAQLNEIIEISSMATIQYVRQKEPLGLGHALLCAEQFVGDGPFAVLLGDDIMDSSIPGIQQLIEVFERTNQSVVGVQEVPYDNVSKYGVIQPRQSSQNPCVIEDLIEKPSRDQAPSNLAIMGRYVLKPTIFRFLRDLKKGAGDEYQLTDALKESLEYECINASILEGERYDVGHKLGYIQATLELGLKRSDLNEDLFALLRNFVENEKKGVM
ncbi:UTP--glucose-1-phosphate uridylyltransferase GalU [Salibacterium lacus]|uniref:UTP--glucose-1-phosphate uridylyltransferase n=1 Tax=Salibacterium lacus TaxID=1898109 RepID=A0ABW5T3N5_9BACI